MISNSVTHLWSYTNSAIADIAGNSAPISQETPRERRCCRAERQCCRAKRRCLRIERRYHCIERRVFECFVMFHNVLRVFHDVSQCFKSVSWCFTSSSRCFTTFHNVLEVLHAVLLCFTLFSESRNDRHRRIGNRASDDRLRDRGNSAGQRRSAITPQKLAITPQKSAMTPQGSWIETEVTLFLEDNFQSCLQTGITVLRGDPPVGHNFSSNF